MNVQRAFATMMEMQFAYLEFVNQGMQFYLSVYFKLFKSLTCVISAFYGCEKSEILQILRTRKN